MNIFVLMSFDNEFDEVYNYIKSIFEDNGHNIFRADDLLNQQNILKDILVSIYKSDLIISDLTGLNPNVFYELGLAHALRKNVVLLTQDISELPFDLKSYRVIEYSTHFSRIDTLKSKLLNIINEISAGNLLFSNPVNDWLGLQVEQIKTKSDSKETEKKEEVESDDDLGFIDFVADIEEALGEMTEIIEQFAKKTEEIGQRASEDTIKINNAWKNESQGTASFVRKITRKTAIEMNKYGNFTKSYNQKYEELWNNYENRVLGLLESEIPIFSKEDFDSFVVFVQSQSNMKPIMEASKESLYSMLESIIGLKGTQKDITRAAKLIEIELSKFIGSMEKSISTIERISKLGEAKVSQLKSKFN